MKKGMGGIKYIALSIVFLLAFLTNILYVFRTPRHPILQLLLLLVLMFFGIIGMIAAIYDSNFGYVLLMLVYAVGILNVVLFLNNYINLPIFLRVYLIFAGLGFIISIASIKKPEEEYQEYSAPEEEKAIEDVYGSGVAAAAKEVPEPPKPKKKKSKK
jgi:predicted membrane protein